MWRRVSCEQLLHTSQSILSPRRKPMLMECAFFECVSHTVGRKGIRFLFRNPAAEPFDNRALVREFVGVTQQDLETPSGDPGRVFFSV